MYVDKVIEGQNDREPAGVRSSEQASEGQK